MRTHTNIQFLQRLLPLLLFTMGLLMVSCEKDKIEEPVSKLDENGKILLTREVRSSIPMVSASSSIPPGEWLFCLETIEDEDNPEKEPVEYFIPGEAYQKQDSTYMHLLLPEGTECISYVVKYVVNSSKTNYYDLGFMITILESGDIECTDVFNEELQLFGKGLKAWPYSISSLADLKAISAASRKSNLSNVYFSQICDIDCNNMINLNENNGGLEPIGMNTAFEGNYNGNDKKIDNLKIVASGVTNDMGLFSALTGNAVVENLTMGNSNLLDMKENVGGIAGKMKEKSSIKKCMVSGGTITGTKNVGGIVGLMEGGTVINCRNQGCTVTPNLSNTPSTSNMGGIIGLISSNSEAAIQVSDLACATNVTGHENVGGIIGLMGGTKAISLKNLSMDLNLVTGERSVGGIIGGCTGELDIKDCNSRAIIKSYEKDMRDYGGIIGAVGTDKSLSMDNCKTGYNSLGTQPDPSKVYITGELHTGGLVGYIRANAGATIKNCGMAANISGTTYVGGMVGRTTTQLTIIGCENRAKEVKASISYAGGLVGSAEKDISIEGVTISSNVISGGEYAGGCVGCVKGATITLKSSLVNGNVSAKSRYGGGHIGYASKIAVSSFKQEESIITVSASEYQGGVVGYAEQGTIEGVNLGYKIGNPESVSASSGGIVGFLVSGTIKNCTFSGSVQGGQFTGGIAGRQNGGSIEDCNTNSKNKILCNADGYVGGIVGGMTEVTISNCTNNTIVENQYQKSHTGGIVGYIDKQNDSRQIKDCKNKARVSGGNQTGGILGGTCNNSSNNTQIVRCHNEGVISGKEETGGISGCFGQGQMIYCSNHNQVQGTKSIGGIAGCHYGNAGFYAGGLVRESYNIGVVSGTGNSTENLGGLVGRFYDWSHARILSSYNVARVGKDGDKYCAGIVGDISDNAYSSIHYCYSGGKERTGWGIFGRILNETIMQCDWKYCHYSAESGGNDGYNTTNYTRNSDAGLGTQSNFKEWDFNSTWIMKGRPQLRNNLQY